MAPRPRALLIAAAGIAGAFVILLVVAYRSPDARELDRSALQGFRGLQGPTVTPATKRVASLADEKEVALIGLGTVTAALARRRPQEGLLVIALLVLTTASSQVLQSALAYPRDSGPIVSRHHGVIVDAEVGPAAFPSGHATAAMSLAIALVIVVPARLRPAAALVGVGFALGVSLSILSMGWHFPSDMAAGFLVAAGWAMVLLAALHASAPVFRERNGRSRVTDARTSAVDEVATAGLTTTLLAGVVGAMLVTAVVVVLGLSDIAYAEDHVALFPVAGTLALSAVAVVFGVAGALTRHD